MYVHDIDGKQLCKRVIKYVLEGLMVMFAAMVLPRQKPDLEAVFALGLVAAATFAILDMFASDVGAAARSGAGFSIGAGLVGGLPLVR